MDFVKIIFLFYSLDVFVLSVIAEKLVSYYNFILFLCSVPFFTQLFMAKEEFELQLYLYLAPIC